MNKIIKLSPTQQELHDAMKIGVLVYYRKFGIGTGPYYFRSDTYRHCTAPARALLRLGLIERFDRKFERPAFRLKESL